MDETGRCHKGGFSHREVVTSIFIAPTVGMMGTHKLVKLVLYVLEEPKK